MKFLSQLKGKKGQSVLEYVILSGLIGVMSLMAIKNLGDTVKVKIESMEKKISSKVRF